MHGFPIARQYRDLLWTVGRPMTPIPRTQSASSTLQQVPADKKKKKKCPVLDRGSPPGVRYFQATTDMNLL